VDDRERLKLFEQTVLPHLDAVYNWLAGNDRDAQDVGQEASLRAFRFFKSFRGTAFITHGGFSNVQRPLTR
jgi:RNA polymerase sigma-70 factor (ECF subfamily)